MTDSVPAHDQQVVDSAAGPGELLITVLVLSDDPTLLVDLDVTTHLVSAIVFVGDVRVEADQARESTLAAVGLTDDLFVVDALEELPCERNALCLAELVGLVQKRVRDELQALLDQLVMNLPLTLDLLRRLKLGGEACLELPEPHIMETRSIHVVTGDSTLGTLADFDRPGDGPIRVIGVVYWNKNLSIHTCLQIIESLSDSQLGCQ